MTSCFPLVACPCQCHSHRLPGANRDDFRKDLRPERDGTERVANRYVGVVSDVVRIELGVSILEGELIAQEVVAGGLRVELVRNEYPETGAMFALGTCALLVAAEHEAELREFLATHGY